MMPTAPSAPVPQRGVSRLKAVLVLASVAVVFGGAGAVGTDVALGSSSKPPAPKTAVPKKPAIPTAFQALPSACELLTAGEVAQVIQHSKDPEQTSSNGPMGDPGSVCEWGTSSDFIGTHRDIEIDLDMHPSTAQGGGTDLAKQAFDKKAASDTANANKPVKNNAGQVFTYGPLIQIPNLAEEAYSTYYVISMPGMASDTPFGYSEVKILRGNTIITVQSSGFDSAPSDQPTAKVPPLTDSVLRPMAEAMARYVVPNINSCTACASH